MTDAPVGAVLEAQPGPSGELVHSVTKLDRAIKQRRDNDVALTSWWLYFLLLSWITFGIYSIVLFFKRIHRIDRFSERKHAYYDAVLEWTERKAEQQGKLDLVRSEIVDLRSAVQHAYAKDLRPINAGLSFLFSIITLGIYGFVVLYRMNRYWWDAQVLEQDFDDQLSQTWIKLGLARYPLTFQVDSSTRRSFPLYLILSFVTFGLWGLVWDYKIHIDPDKLFGEYHSIEDSVLQVVRAN
jgi:hypothetical protein